MGTLVKAKGDVSGTTALILTFSPGEKGQRLYASLYAVVRRANSVAGALRFRGSMRELVGRNGFRVFEHLPGLVYEVAPPTVSFKMI